MRIRRWVWAWVLLIVALVMGCGGGSKGRASGARGAGGKVAFTVRWPARSPSASRVIPIAADTILFTFISTGASPVTIGGDADKITRPFGDAGGSSTYTRDLPVGGYTVSARAFSAQDANVPVATGSAPLTIKGGMTAQATLTLGSTVTQLLVSAAASSVAVGGTTTLTATPRDKDGNLVLVGPATVAWTSSDPTVATVDGSGLTPMVHALKAGSVTFTATFNEVEPSLGQVLVVSTPFAFAVTRGGYLYRVEETDLPTGGSQVLLTRSALDGSDRTLIRDISQDGVLDGLALSTGGAYITYAASPEGGAGESQVVIDAGTGTVLYRFQHDAYVFGLTSSQLYREEENDLGSGSRQILLTRSALDGSGRTVICDISQDGIPDGLALSSDGAYITYAASPEGGAGENQVVVDARTGAVLHKFSYSSFVFGATSSQLYREEEADLPSGGRQVLLTRSAFDGGGRTVIRDISQDGIPDSLVLSSDGAYITYLASPSGGGQSQVVIDAQTGATLYRFTYPSFIFGIGP